MSEPVHTSETPTPVAPETPPTPNPEPPSWSDVFKDEDPLKVKQSLEHSRKWEQRAKENADAARRLKEIEDRDLSELQKAQRDREELSAQLAAVQAEAVRNRVALTKGLPPEVASILAGSNEEELTAHADALLAWRGNVAPPTPRPDPGQGPRPSTPQADEDQLYSAFFPNG